MSSSVARTGQRALPWFRKIGWVLSGNLIYALSQLGVVVLVENFGGLTDVGAFGLALAITGPIFIAGNLNLAAVLVSDARREFSFRSYFQLRLWTVLIAFTGIVVVSYWFDTSRFAWMVLLGVTLAKAIESLGDIARAYWQREESFFRTGVTRGMAGLLSLAGFGAVYAFGGDISGGVFAMACLWALCFFPLFFGIKFDGNAAEGDLGMPLRSLVFQAAPLALVMLILTLAAALPRYFLGLWENLETLGVFVSFAYILTGAGQLVLAVGASHAPRLAVLFANEPEKFRESARTTILLSAVLAVVVATTLGLSAPVVVGVLFSSELAPYVNFFRFLGLAIIPQYLASIFGFILTAARDYRGQLVPAVMMLVSSLIVGIWAVPEFGLYGAAVQLVVGTSVLAISLGVKVGLLLRGQEGRQAG